jgi:hypothetical protein
MNVGIKRIPISELQFSFMQIVKFVVIVAVKHSLVSTLGKIQSKLNSHELRELMMSCEWVRCYKRATHHEVYWGEVVHLCDEHYELVGKDEDYETLSSNE